MSSAKRTKRKRKQLRPFAEQEPFLQDDKRFYGYISGVGAGKTYAGVLRTALNMEHWNPGQMGAIVAPTTTMIKNAILPLIRETGLLAHWDYKSAHTNEPGLHAPNGSRALILSAENRRNVERLANLNLAWWWLDEGPRTPPRALEILEQRLRIADAYLNGYITGTPMGQDHIYDFFVGNHPTGTERTHGEGEVYEVDDRLAIIHVPTWANPHTDVEYKEQMAAKEGQVYEREVLGRFVDYEGLVYGWFDPEQHVRPADAREANLNQVFYGVDWGFNNPAAIVACAITTRGGVWVLDEFYQSGVDRNDMVAAAKELQDRHRAGPFYCDPAEPAAIETFHRAGIDAIGAENAILPGIQHVTSLRDDLTIADHCNELRNEFNQYRYPEDSDHEKPVDMHNHALDALRYALFTHAQRGGLSVGVEGLDVEYLG